LNIKSTHYAKQSKFKGSERELRGAIVKEILKKPSTVDHLATVTKRKKSEVVRVVAALSSEGIITLRAGKFVILDA
jgi:predicted transcriptional regulator